MRLSTLGITAVIVALLMSSTPSYAGLGGIGIGWWTENPVVKAVSGTCSIAGSVASSVRRAAGSALWAVRPSNVAKATMIAMLVSANPANAEFLSARQMYYPTTVAAQAIAVVGGSYAFNAFNDYYSVDNPYQTIMDDPQKRLLAVLYHPEYFEGSNVEEAIDIFKRTGYGRDAVARAVDTAMNELVEENLDDYIQTLNARLEWSGYDLTDPENIFSSDALAAQRSATNSDFQSNLQYSVAFFGLAYIALVIRNDAYIRYLARHYRDEVHRLGYEFKNNDDKRRYISNLAGYAFDDNSMNPIPDIEVAALARASRLAQRGNRPRPPRPVRIPRVEAPAADLPRPPSGVIAVGTGLADDGGAIQAAVRQRPVSQYRAPVAAAQVANVAPAAGVVLTKVFSHGVKLRTVKKFLRKRGVPFDPTRDNQGHSFYRGPGFTGSVGFGEHGGGHELTYAELGTLNGFCSANQLAP